MKPLYSLFLLAVLVFPSFMNGSTALSGHPYNEDELPVAEIIREYINQLENSHTIKLSKQKIIGNQVIFDLYKKVDFQPVWVNADNRKDLIKILDDSYFEGLNPDDYHIDFIKEHNDHITSGARVTMEEYAIADIVMTNAALSFAFHMIQGKVNPTTLDPNWN